MNLENLNEPLYYNILFQDNEKNIESIISFSQPYKEGDEIGIDIKIDENFKNKWIEDLKTEFKLYKIINVYHEIKIFYSDKKRMIKNIIITLKEIEKSEE